MSGRRRSSAFSLSRQAVDPGATPLTRLGRRNSGYSRGSSSQQSTTSGSWSDSDSSYDSYDDSGSEDIYNSAADDSSSYRSRRRSHSRHRSVRTGHTGSSRRTTRGINSQHAPSSRRVRSIGSDDASASVATGDSRSRRRAGVREAVTLDSVRFEDESVTGQTDATSRAPADGLRIDVDEFEPPHLKVLELLPGRTSSVREWRSWVMKLLREVPALMTVARRKKAHAPRQGMMSHDEYDAVMALHRRDVKKAYEQGIYVLKAALGSRPESIDTQEGRSICTKLVLKILELYQNSLDAKERRDALPTRTPAFLWLERTFNDYQAGRRGILGSNSTLDNPFGFAYKQVVGEDKQLKWECINPDNLRNRKLFKTFLLTRYPYIHTVLAELATMYDAAGNEREATAFALHALHVATEVMPANTAAHLQYWERAKELHSRQRMSRQSFREFVTWQISLREPYMDPRHPLMQTMHLQRERLQSNRYERIGNIFLVYSGYIVVALLTALAVSYASCAGAPQWMTVSQDTFSYSNTEPVFSDVSRYPACAERCQSESQATCSQFVCSCVEVGCRCWCENPVFDACNSFGSLRRGLRQSLYLLFFAVSYLEVGIFAFGLFLVRWPDVPVETEALRDSFRYDRFEQMHDCAVLIATHGPPSAIQATVRAALQIFPPDQIYICHNGPTKYPADKGQTRQFCLDVVREAFPGSRLRINYNWICEGNKTLALYMVALKTCRENYCMIMDNDVLLPEDLYVPMHEFDDPLVKALCFTIRADNLSTATGHDNALTHLQDIEYKKAGLVKMLQSKLGSTFYAHGAIALWERETMLRVLHQHNTMFHGEDLQMGFLLHRMNKNYRMKVVGSVSVPTTVPNHLICWPIHYSTTTPLLIRLFAAPFHCQHKEKSLFQQRSKSWDAAAHRVGLLLLSTLLFSWKRSTIGLKPFLTYSLWSIIQDWLRLPFFILVLSGSVPMSKVLTAAVLLYLSQVVMMLALNYWTFRHRRDLRSDLRYLLLFPLYLVALLTLRFTALLYNALVYLPMERNKTKIKNRTFLPTVYAYAHGRYYNVDGDVDQADEDADDELLEHKRRLLQETRRAQRPAPEL